MVTARAATDDNSPKKPIPVVCKVVRLIRATRVNPPRPAAFPRQHAVTAERWSQTESTTAAEVTRQRRELDRSDPAARAGWLTVPTLVRAMPWAAMVVAETGAQAAIRFRPMCGCNGKSRPEGRTTSSHGAPARWRP